MLMNLNGQHHVELDLNDYVCLINCPMSDKQYNQVYTVEFLGNVVEGLPIRYLNVESDIMKKAAVKAIKNDAELMSPGIL